ncbi:hypothetical protein C8J57DRAFT_1405115 [Mycena rebaudengoi]|nr:hypothetical protein C8J57DRAFT_1405115 [Mycena rebaudengoi]
MPNLVTLITFLPWLLRANQQYLIQLVLSQRHGGAHRDRGARLECAVLAHGGFDGLQYVPFVPGVRASNESGSGQYVVRYGGGTRERHGERIELIGYTVQGN